MLAHHISSPVQRHKPSSGSNPQSVGTEADGTSEETKDGHNGSNSHVNMQQSTAL